MTPQDLPTEPYTVIRVTWREPPEIDGAGEVLLLNRAGEWQIESDQYAAGVLAREITGFDILSTPGPKTDFEYDWTAKQWRDWSLKLSAMLPEEADGDEDELSIIEDFVRQAAQGAVLSPAQVDLVSDLIETAAESWRKGPRGLDELRDFAESLGLGEDDDGIVS